MSSWVALNVAYNSSDWEMPDLFLSRINAHEHPNEGFDLLLDVFTSHIRGREEDALDAMSRIAWIGGEPETMISVRGSDTSEMFTFQQLDRNGIPLETWANHKVNDFSVESVDVLSEIEEEIGARPSYGGNYRDH